MYRPSCLFLKLGEGGPATGEMLRVGDTVSPTTGWGQLAADLESLKDRQQHKAGGVKGAPWRPGPLAPFGTLVIPSFRSPAGLTR